MPWYCTTCQTERHTKDEPILILIRPIFFFFFAFPFPNLDYQYYFLTELRDFQRKTNARSLIDYDKEYLSDMWKINKIKMTRKM